MTREDMLMSELYQRAQARLPAELHPTFWLMCGLYGEAAERLIKDERWRCWYEGMADVLLGLVEAQAQGVTLPGTLQAQYDESVKASTRPRTGFVRPLSIDEL